MRAGLGKVREELEVSGGDGKNGVGAEAQISTVALSPGPGAWGREEEAES